MTRVPLPIVVFSIWGVAALAAVGGIGLAIWKVANILADKKLAILGSPRVGKTTLFQMLRDGKVPKVADKTTDAEPGTTFTLKVSGKDIRFEIPKDVNGNGGVAFPEWRKAFDGADFVLYLFRADQLAAGDEKTVKMVSNHLTLMKGWLVARKGQPPKIVLVGTFADQSLGFPETRHELNRVVADQPAIKAALVKLNNAGLVVGSLASTRLASSLIKSIEKAL